MSGKTSLNSSNVDLSCYCIRGLASATLFFITIVPGRSTLTGPVSFEIRRFSPSVIPCRALVHALDLDFFAGFGVSVALIIPKNIGCSVLLANLAACLNDMKSIFSHLGCLTHFPETFMFLVVATARKVGVSNKKLGETSTSPWGCDSNLAESNGVSAIR